MGEKNGSVVFFNWIGVVKLTGSDIFLSHRWCFRLNWKEGRLMVGNKRKCSSRFGLIFISVTCLSGSQRLLCSDWIILCSNGKAISHMGLMGPKGVTFSKSVFPNGRVLLILLERMRHESCRGCPAGRLGAFTKSERRNSLY